MYGNGLFSITNTQKGVAAAYVASNRDGGKRERDAVSATNVLGDEEWAILLEGAFKVARATTHEDLRMAALQTFRQLIPFQSAVFFLVDPSSCNIVDCIIAQPLGADLSAADYKAFMRAQWISCDPEAEKPCASRVYACSARELADGANESRFGALSNSKMLACDIAGANGPLGSLALTRNSLQGDYNYRDLYIAQVLEPYLTKTLVSMYEGGRYAVLKGDRLHDDCNLTKREIMVTECVIYGMTTPEIARKLGISTNTAKKHLENIYRKIGVNNRMSLMRFAQHYMSAE